MINSPPHNFRARARRLALSGLLVLQVGAAAFFAFDIIADIAGWEDLSQGATHLLLEAGAVVGLIAGLWVTGREMRRMRRRQRRIEAQLRVASGAFVELLEEHFERWNLTPSERDVALLSIKGLSIAEIAAVRGTREGTVKAQCNAVYAKAGVTGRQQLLGLFIEELMGEALLASDAEVRRPAA